MASIPLRLCKSAAGRLLVPRLVGFRSKRLMTLSSVNTICDKRGERARLPRVENVAGFHVSALRWRKKTGKRKAAVEEEASSEEESEEESSDEDDDAMASDYKLVDCPVSALRVDTVAKVALGLPRVAVEQLMYEGKIRVDGQLCRKKGATIGTGTTIDYLLEASTDNPDFTTVRRIIVDKIHDRTDSQGRLLVRVKKWASLTVDDYKLGAAKSDEAD